MRTMSLFPHPPNVLPSHFLSFIAQMYQIYMSPDIPSDATDGYRKFVRDIWAATTLGQIRTVHLSGTGNKAATCDSVVMRYLRRRALAGNDAKKLNDADGIIQAFFSGSGGAEAISTREGWFLDLEQRPADYRP